MPLHGRGVFAAAAASAGAAVFLSALFLFIAGTGIADERGESEWAAITESVIRRAAVSCYALEGAYPPNLEYLIKNYGVRYDSDKYIVRYSAFAPNLMPTVAVIIK